MLRLLHFALICLPLLLSAQGTPEKIAQWESEMDSTPVVAENQALYKGSSPYRNDSTSKRIWKVYRSGHIRGTYLYLDGGDYPMLHLCSEAGDTVMLYPFALDPDILEEWMMDDTKWRGQKLDIWWSEVLLDCIPLTGYVERFAIIRKMKVLP